MGRTRQLAHELTPRQRQVLELLARGHTNAEIGEKLGITLAGAKWHVSELLTKLDAATREDLAERWLKERRPGQRLRRWFGGIAAVGPVKVSATAFAGAAALVAGIGVAAGVIALREGDDRTLAAPLSSTETLQTAAAPPPALPAATLPAAAPGAKWTPQEALDYATDFMNERILSGESIDARVATPPPVTVSELVQAEWLPGINRFNAMDGDRYWAPNDALARDAWHFRWVVNGVPVAGLSTPTRTFWAELLLIDGSVQEPLAWEIELIGPGRGQRSDRRRRRVSVQSHACQGRVVL